MSLDQIYLQYSNWFSTDEQLNSLEHVFMQATDYWANEPYEKWDYY